MYQVVEFAGMHNESQVNDVSHACTSRGDRAEFNNDVCALISPTGKTVAAYRKAQLTELRDMLDTVIKSMKS